jgi:hypothetical protein
VARIEAEVLADLGIRSLLAVARVDDAKEVVSRREALPETVIYGPRGHGAGAEKRMAET